MERSIYVIKMHISSLFEFVFQKGLHCSIKICTVCVREVMTSEILRMKERSSKSLLATFSDFSYSKEKIYTCTLI